MGGEATGTLGRVYRYTGQAWGSPAVSVGFWVNVLCLEPSNDNNDKEQGGSVIEAGASTFAYVLKGALGLIVTMERLRLHNPTGLKLPWVIRGADHHTSNQKMGRAHHNTSAKGTVAHDCPIPSKWTTCPSRLVAWVGVGVGSALAPGSAALIAARAVSRSCFPPSQFAPNSSLYGMLADVSWGGIRREERELEGFRDTPRTVSLA